MRCCNSSFVYTRSQPFAVVRQLECIVSFFSATLIWRRPASMIWASRVGWMRPGFAPVWSSAVAAQGHWGGSAELARNSRRGDLRLEVPRAPVDGLSLTPWWPCRCKGVSWMLGLIAGASRQGCAGAQSWDVGTVCAQSWLGLAWFVRRGFAPCECGRRGNFFTWART